MREERNGYDREWDSMEPDKEESLREIPTLIDHLFLLFYEILHSSEREIPSFSASPCPDQFRSPLPVENRF